MTDADIRRTIELVFKVRDEVTPAVRSITRTAEDAKAGMEGLIAVQDGTASSAEALRATLSDTRAETSASTAEAQRLVREALRARDEAEGRMRALAAERDALKTILSEGLEAPEVDLSKVREGIAEAERLADVKVEIRAPDVSPVRDASEDAVDSVASASAEAQRLMADLGAMLSEGLEGPDLSAVEESRRKALELVDVDLRIEAPDLSPVERAVASARAEMDRTLAFEAPDLSPVEDAVGRAVDMVREGVGEARAIASAPITIEAPDVSPVRDAVDDARAMASAPITMEAPDTTAAMDAVRQVRDAVSEVSTVPVPDTSEAEGAIESVHAEASEPYSVAVPDTAQARAEVESVRAGVESAIAQIDAQIEAESQRAQELAEQAATAIAASQADARTEIQATSAEMDVQSSKITNQLVAIGALKGGVSAMIGGVQQLGIVSDDTAQVLGKINAAFGIMAGAAGTIKAIQGAMAALNVATAINASLNSFNAVLQNPAMLAGVGLAAGAAIGVAGTYLVMNQDQSSTSTTINVVDGSEGRSQFGAEVYDIVNGGAL